MKPRRDQKSIDDKNMAESRGLYDALSYEASCRLREQAWQHVHRINPKAAQKIRKFAQTR